MIIAHRMRTSVTPRAVKALTRRKRLLSERLYGVSGGAASVVGAGRVSKYMS
jgi:hypothetical protein